MSLRRIALPAVAAAALIIPGGSAPAQTLTGAGATFPFPIYSKWFDVYQQEAGAKVNYQSIGSGRWHPSDHRGDRRFRGGGRPDER